CDRPDLPRQRQLHARFQAGGRRCGAIERRIHRQHIAAVVFAQPPRLAVLEQRVPLVPRAFGVAVLEPADEREGGALILARRTELQGRVVVKQLGALADLAQRLAVADDRALAEAADRERRRGRPELDRRAAVRTRRAVGALR